MPGCELHQGTAVCHAEKNQGIFKNNNESLPVQERKNINVRIKLTSLSRKDTLMSRINKEIDFRYDVK